MVTVLWKACSDGDLQKVQELLKDASSVDMETKDHTGATPLIQAVRNGHYEVVRELLERGADPMNSSSQGRPEQYTSDPAILELLGAAQNRVVHNGMPAAMYDPNQGYTHDPSRGYYPPPAPYAYYPSMYPGLPPMPEGVVPYYPPPPPPQPLTNMGEQPSDSGSGNGGGTNLPPPDVARLIPCRYFPACRYGASCMFAHPQVPYFQGPLPPPAQYPAPYDSMTSPPYPQNYYPVPPVSFSPNGMPSHMGPMSPHTSPPPMSPAPSAMHARSSSEMMSPGQQAFSPPPGGPIPIPYGSVSPISPSYPHMGQIPGPIPLASPPVLPLQTPPHPQSPPIVYHPTSPTASVPPFSHRRDSIGKYPPQVLTSPPPSAPAQMTSMSPPLRPQTDGYAPAPSSRDGMTHARRGSVRRPSFGGSRKPPCLFFPSGRCRNGDECRFPHVMPDGSGPPPNGSFTNGRFQRPRVGVNGSNFDAIDEKMAGMTIRDDRPTSQNGRPDSMDSARKSNHLTNGARAEKRAVPKQRVPSADDFPVLGGTVTPPLRNSTNGALNGHTGPTAAQILQAPAPIRQDSSKSISEQGRPSQNAQVDGVLENVVPNGKPIKPATTFAAVATVAPDATKTVPVSA